jgi:hypothetical protein
MQASGIRHQAIGAACDMFGQRNCTPRSELTHMRTGDADFSPFDFAQSKTSVETATSERGTALFPSPHPQAVPELEE